MKLKTKFENNQSFFKTMATTITDFDLWDENVGEAMDYFYFQNHSGEKPCSPLVENWQGQLSQLAIMVYQKYQKNWEQAAAYLTADYDLYEDREYEKRTKTGSDTQTPENWKVTNTGLAADNISEVENETYGFNSAQAVPEGKSTSRSSHKSTSEQSGTLATVYDTVEELERHGSSKLRTGAEMLALDDRFWSNWNFFELIFKNADRELTCPYYE